MGALIEIVKHLKPTTKWATRDDSFSSRSQAQILRWQYYYPPRNFETMLRAYLTNPWVYAAVYLIATTAAAVPFKLYTRTTQQPADTDHFLWRVLKHPNPHTTFTDLLEATFIYMELIGNAFWELVYNADGFIKNIYLLDPCKMRIIPDPVYYIRGYEYEVNGQKVFFAPHEIAHFKYFNPTNEYWGVGSLQAVWDQLILDDKATDYNARFFENDATPSGVITSPRPISDSVFNQLQRRWAERHEGSVRAHRVALLDDGMKFEPIATTPREASFPELRKSIRDSIFVGLGVPPVLAGVPDVANYSTARVAQSIFYDSTVAPKLRKVADVIDQAIIEPQDPALMGNFDTSMAPINVVKLSANSRIISRLAQANLITANEARALLGLPPLREEMKLENFTIEGASDAAIGEAQAAESDGTVGLEN